MTKRITIDYDEYLELLKKQENEAQAKEISSEIIRYCFCLQNKFNGTTLVVPPKYLDEDHIRALKSMFETYSRNSHVR